MSTALLSIIMIRLQVIFDVCKKHMYSEWVGVSGFVFIRAFTPPPPFSSKKKRIFNFFFTFVSRQDIRPTMKKWVETNHSWLVWPKEFSKYINQISHFIYTTCVTILNILQQINKMPVQSDQWNTPPPHLKLSACNTLMGWNAQGELFFWTNYLSWY